LQLKDAQFEEDKKDEFGAITLTGTIEEPTGSVRSQSFLERKINTCKE